MRVSCLGGNGPGSKAMYWRVSAYAASPENCQG